VEHQEQNGYSQNGNSSNGHSLNGHAAAATNGHEPVSAEAPKSDAANDKRKLHHLGKARKRQGLSVRCVAQRLNKTVGEVREQEDDRADILLSELYRWQKVLEVPLEELLREPTDALSPRVRMRAQMLRIMKTARALRSQARSEGEARLARLLIGQLIEIMPELKEVAAWPTVGHRRTADELGRIAEHPIPDDWMHEAS
jgi:transcriptional regulator with XRE-family HTH domain